MSNIQDMSLSHSTGPSCTMHHADHSTAGNRYSLCTTPYHVRYMKYVYIIRLSNAFILSSRQPKSPPSTKWLFFLRQPPLGVLSLKYQRKLVACLKWGPTVKISCIRSSTQMMPNLPDNIEDIKTQTQDQRNAPEIAHQRWLTLGAERQTTNAGRQCCQLSRNRRMVFVDWHISQQVQQVQCTCILEQLYMKNL